VHSTEPITMVTAIAKIKYSRETLNLGDNIGTDYLLHKTSTNYLSKSNLRNTGFTIYNSGFKTSYKICLEDKIITLDSNHINIEPIFIDTIVMLDNFGLSDSNLASIYQIIQFKDQEQTLNNFIKEFDDSIEAFKVIGDKPQCKTNGEYRDITEFGNGLKHYISIICALYACSNGYLFIDEIDNGIHYSQLDRLWQLIFTLSKITNCQVFASTHSKEMLEAFTRVAKKLNEQDISYTLLVKNKQQEIKAINMDYEMLLDSMAQNHEVRGW